MVVMVWFASTHFYSGMITSIKTVLRQDLRRIEIILAKCAFPDLLNEIRSAYSPPVTRISLTSLMPRQVFLILSNFQ